MKNTTTQAIIAQILLIGLCVIKNIPTIPIIRTVSYHSAISTRARFEPERSVLTIDRTHAGRGVTPGDETVDKRTVQLRKRGSELDLRILLDRWSVEVFINQGEQVISASLYIDPDAQEILFRADGKAEMNIIQYQLEKNDYKRD